MDQLAFSSAPQPGETAGPQSECKGLHAAQPHGRNSHWRTKRSSSCRKARSSLEGRRQARSWGDTAQGGWEGQRRLRSLGSVLGAGRDKNQSCGRQAGIQVSCSHRHPLSKAALVGNELPVVGSSCKAGKPPVGDSAERVSEGRGQVNGTQVQGVPSPPCDSGQGIEPLKSSYFFICKRET